MTLPKCAARKGKVLPLAVAPDRGWRSFAPPSVLPDISPARGEIALSFAISRIVDDVEEERAMKPPISPLAGEMSGRTEGGNVERSHSGIRDGFS